VLALIAVIGAATIPFWGSASRGQGEEIESSIREFVRTNRTAAIRRNEPRRLTLTERSLEGPEGSVSLPGGWRLDVRRFGTDNFHSPRSEIWEITPDGLLEPLILRATSLDSYHIDIEFCPLTALPPFP